MAYDFYEYLMEHIEDDHNKDVIEQYHNDFIEQLLDDKYNYDKEFEDASNS